MNTAPTAVPAAAEPRELLGSLHARYAVKKFDPAGKIAAETWDALEQTLQLAPSSYGLQPWKFFVVENSALRAKLREASWGQSQITDAHKLVVFAVKKGFGAADVERFVARVAEVRGVPVNTLDAYKGMMLNSVNRPAAAVEAWTSRQVYIALGSFLTAAAVLGVDACPMEGIDGAKYDELLGLSAQGYSALAVATAGRRAQDDGYAAMAKVRYPREQVVVSVK